MKSVLCMKQKIKKVIPERREVISLPNAAERSDKVQT